VNPPKPAPTNDDDSPPKMSIAELAAKINLNALDPSKNPNNPTNRMTQKQF
jgi:hypothetical protein